MNLNERAISVVSRRDFVDFVRLLEHDRRTCGAQWESQSIEDYMESIAAWVEDMDGGSCDQEQLSCLPSWQLFARILLAAKYYE